MKKLIFLTIFLLSTSALAELQFHWSPSQAWEAKLNAAEEEVSNFLGEDFSYPEWVRIAYMPDKSISYSITNKAIYMGEFYRPLFLHEYTHALFDDYMFRKSPGWFFYRIKTYLKNADLEESIEKTKKDLIKYRETLQEFKEQGLDEKYLNNLRKTIASTEENLGFFKRALKMESDYLEANNQLNIMKLIAPYHELLADVLPVLLTEDWGLMREASESSIQRRGENLYIPEGGNIEEVMAHREFRLLGPLKDHRFQSWEVKGPYTQFAPVRSYLRKLSHHVDNGRIVAKLFSILKDEFEEILKNQSLWGLSLREKNRRLINKIDNFFQ